MSAHEVELAVLGTLAPAIAMAFWWMVRHGIEKMSADLEKVADAVSEHRKDIAVIATKVEVQGDRIDRLEVIRHRFNGAE